MYARVLRKLIKEYIVDIAKKKGGGKNQTYKIRGKNY